jgi:putative transposase
VTAGPLAAGSRDTANITRPPRIEVPDGIYHVTTRGSNRGRIVFDDADRRRWVARLAAVVHRMQWVLSGWCLMTTHFHLVVQIPECGLSRGMQILNTGHSHSVSRRRGRTCHLFENRFAAKLIQSDAHFLATHRYVALNPVEAGICAHPSDYAWGSFRAIAALEPRPAFLAPARVLELLADVGAYVRLVESGLPTSG